MNTLKLEQLSSHDGSETAAAGFSGRLAHAVTHVLDLSSLLKQLEISELTGGSTMDVTWGGESANLMTRAEERVHFPMAWHVGIGTPARDRMERSYGALGMEMVWVPRIIWERPKVTCHPASSSSSWIRIRSCDLHLNPAACRDWKTGPFSESSAQTHLQNFFRDLSQCQKNRVSITCLKFYYLFFWKTSPMKFIFNLLLIFLKTSPMNFNFKFSTPVLLKWCVPKCYFNF